MLEKLEKEAELQLQLSVLSTKAWGSCDEAALQAVDGEATAGAACGCSRASASPSMKRESDACTGEELLGSPYVSEGLC